MPTRYFYDPKTGQEIEWTLDRDPTPAELEQLSAAQTPPAGGAAGRLAKGVWRNLNPVTTLQTLLTRRASVPMDILRASFEQGRKAFSAETPSEAFRLGLSTFPVIGPAAAATEETAKRGDVAGALGEAIGLALPFAVGGGLKGVAAARPAARATKAAILRKQAENIVSKEVLAPTVPRYQALAARRAPEILQRRLKGSREGLLTGAEARLQTLGQELETAVAKYPKTEMVKTSPIVADMNTTLEGLTSKGISGKAEVVPGSAGEYQHLKALRDFTARRGSQMTWDHANRVRRLWDNRTAKVGGFAEKSGDVGLADEAWAIREGASALRREFGKERPDIAAINRELSFNYDLRDILTAGKPRGERRGGSGLRGALGGGLAAESPVGKLGSIWLFSEVERFLTSAVRSPRWKLMSARRKYQLADALARGEVGKAKQLLAEFGEVMPRETSMMEREEAQ